ncbi:MAG: hypothetical protein LC620_08405, partial [Halobacteriales archaeon]|nr:hypothetical protein [Halobacteriales archaeon]
MLLEFFTTAAITGSPYFVGGHGTELDPYIIHVTGCLQIFVHVKNIKVHLQFNDMSYTNFYTGAPEDSELCWKGGIEDWEHPDHIQPCPANTTITGLGAPIECGTYLSIFCVHDLGPGGMVSFQDFYPGPHISVVTAFKATLRMYSSPWKAVPKAGCIGALLDKAVLDIRAVPWHGIDCPAILRHATVTVSASNLQTGASWCQANPASLLPPPLAPTEPIGALSAGDATVDLATNTAAALGVPAWGTRGLDELWHKNLGAYGEVTDRETYNSSRYDDYLHTSPGSPSPATNGYVLPDQGITYSPPNERKLDFPLFDIANNTHFESYANILGGGLIGILTYDSNVSVAGTTFGCGGYGIVSKQSEITSLRTRFHSVAIPYLLNGSVDLSDNPFTGFTIDSPAPAGSVTPVAGPAKAFRSLCDIFDGTHPAVVISDNPVTLYGSNFADGFPTHASMAYA